MHSAPRRSLLTAAFKGVLSLSLLAALAAPAQADTYPTKPVTLVVTQGTGSGSDVMARLLAGYLGPLLGQTVVEMVFSNVFDPLPKI